LTEQVNSRVVAKRAMSDHFSDLASGYRKIRTTDLRPVKYIQKFLGSYSKVVAADVGCGTGRYSALLIKHLGEKLFLHCIDSNEFMLQQLAEQLPSIGGERIKVLRGTAEELPLPDESLDALTTFNAVHHFPLQAFLQESCRVLRRGSYLFVYTRFQSQNKRTIWGKYFPRFSEKEDRLYELESISRVSADVPGLNLVKVVPFRYRRRAGIHRLVEQAKGRHYSTFSLYGQEEFGEALDTFERELLQRYKNPAAINWYDENVLLVFQNS